MADKKQTFQKLVDLQHMMGAYHHKTTAHHGRMADPTRGQGRVIALLKMRDGLATRDMAEVLGIRVSSLNETLYRLEADGFVERRPSEDDKRIMLVYLTDKGRQEQQHETDFATLLFDGFSDEELETLDGYLARMGEVLEHELGEDWRERMSHRDEILRGEHEHGHGHGRGCCRHGHGGPGHGHHGPRHGHGGHGHGHRGRGPRHGHGGPDYED